VNQNRAREFREARADELWRLSQILLEEGLIRDQEPITSAASQANRPELIDGVECWGYSFSRLEFLNIDIESNRHARPEGAVVMSIELSVAVFGPCLDDNDLSNPFTTLGVNIVVVGLSADGTKDLKCAWHFDRHIQKEGDPDPVLAHPIYHFQHGGDNVSQLNDYGKHLILDPPRIAHPPLDAVLAVDFVLSNYCGTKWSEMRIVNHAYKDLVAHAQERFWSPYALATAAICKTHAIISPWKVQNIWPQILIDRVIL
jgi:hypothetical protein